MTRIFRYKCFVDGCDFNEKLVYAEKNQIKIHLKHDHDYKELLETAASFEIIKNCNERRSPDWLAESLFEISILRERF